MIAQYPPDMQPGDELIVQIRPHLEDPEQGFDWRVVLVQGTSQGGKQVAFVAMSEHPESTEMLAAAHAFADLDTYQATQYKTVRRESWTARSRAEVAR